MAFKFREHRGGLGESLKTTVTLHDKTALVNHLNKVLWTYEGSVDADLLDITLYSGEDARTGWHKTYIVTFPGYGVLGFTDTKVG